LIRALLIACAAAAPAAALEAYVTEQNGDSLSVVDLDAGAVLRSVPIGGKPAGVAVAPDGGVWITSPDSKTLTRYDPVSDALTRVALSGGPLGIAINPATSDVYVADWYEHRIFVIREGAITAQVATGESPSGVAVTPDGALIVTADRDSDQLSLIDARTLERVAVVPVGVRPFGVTIDAAGGLAYTADVGSDTVTVVDLAARAVVASIPVGARPYAVALAGGRGFVTNSYGDSVTVFDLASRATVAQIDAGEYPEGIAASPDGAFVYVANWGSNTLSVIDVQALKVTAEIAVGDGPRAFGDFLSKK
jgi:YVTN family beta-propeller protein